MAFYTCVYRWLLIFFKRELSYPDLLRLWEALWSQHLCQHFQIFIAAAVLIKHRRQILDNNLNFDELLRFINALAGKIDLNTALQDAEILFKFSGEAGIDALKPLAAVFHPAVVDQVHTDSEGDDED